jgi:glycosyltransferase involved in cell wall biosynthesis
MKILVLHQYYLMPGEGGGSRFNEMARAWVEAGHSVTVIAGNVQYTTGTKPPKYRWRWITKETDGEVSVWRCHVSSLYRKGSVGRAWAFLTFVLSTSTAVLTTGRPDVIIATSPPLFIAIPGWIAARMRRKPVPWVFEVRDLWPESMVTMQILSSDSVVVRALYVLERAACGKSDLINVLTPAFRESILRRGLARESKIVFIPNGADVHRFQPAPRENAVRREYGWGNRTVVIYAGVHGPANALSQLVDAAERLRDRPDIMIACVGDGPERVALERRARGNGLSNIIFCGPQPKERMPDFVNAADIGAAVLQNNPTFRTVYPNKVFDYMACSRPVLIAIDGIARALICDEARAGVFAEPENGDSIAQAIRLLADSPEKCREMGANGRRWVTANASREALAQQYLAVLSQLAKRGEIVTA